jgi:threonine dehydrogenase-like Zn-dependent dehydrogenase
MKGVVFLGNRGLKQADFPDPSAGLREVVLEIKASGMCGSDLHIYRASGAETALGYHASSPTIAGP